jgi:hypothetical protein
LVITRPAKHSRLSPSAVASFNNSERDNSVSHRAKDAQTSLRRLQHHSRHSTSIFADNSSSCEKMSSINDTQNSRHDSSFPLNLGFKDTSAVELPEADAQQYIRTLEDDQALEEKVWEYDELVGYREVNGRAEMAVPWKLTWEPAKEFPPDEVAKIKKAWERQGATSSTPKRDRQRRARERPSSRMTSSGTRHALLHHSTHSKSSSI